MRFLSEKYRFKTLTDAQKRHNEAAIRFLYETPLPRNAWLSGVQGRGKTHIACCALRRHLLHWKKLEPWANDYTMVDAITGPMLRQIANQFSEDREDDIYRYSSVRLLLVDDIDKCDLSNMKPLETLWEIMNQRHMRGYRTIVTSNMTGAATRKFWDAACGKNPTIPGAILDRLQPCEGFVIAGESSLRATHSPSSSAFDKPSAPVEVEPINRAAMHALNTGNIAALARGAA